MSIDHMKALITANPFYIPLTEVAQFLHVKPEALRASIDQGRCPFGFSWKLGERSGYKIPTATFVAWFLKGVSPESLSI